MSQTTELMLKKVLENSWITNGEYQLLEVYGKYHIAKKQRNSYPTIAIYDDLLLALAQYVAKHTEQKGNDNDEVDNC